MMELIFLRLVLGNEANGRIIGY